MRITPGCCDGEHYTLSRRCLVLRDLVDESSKVHCQVAPNLEQLADLRVRAAHKRHTRDEGRVGVEIINIEKKMKIDKQVRRGEKIYIKALACSKA